MVAAGLTPMQVIVSATSDAARCMNVADRLGTLSRASRRTSSCSAPIRSTTSATPARSSRRGCAAAGSPMTAPARGIRWWPAALDCGRLCVRTRLGLAARPRRPGAGHDDLPDRVRDAAAPRSLAHVLLAFVPSWTAFALVAVVAIVVVVAATTRIRGVTGDLVPVLEWRWASREPPALRLEPLPTSAGAECGSAGRRPRTRDAGAGRALARPAAPLRGGETAAAAHVSPATIRSSSARPQR